MPLGFGINDGPIRLGHERVELIKGIDTPNGEAHFVVARETFINADMRVSSAMGKCGRGAFLFRTDKEAIQCNRALTIVPNQTCGRCPRIASSKRWHRPFEATHRQPNTASKSQIARERCPKATNREASKSATDFGTQLFVTR